MISFGKRLRFWTFLLTGKTLPGFDPPTDGMEGIKKLVRRWFPEVRQLRTAELDAWLADSNRPNPQIIDVRKPEEFSTSHLPGARRVDPGVNETDLRSLAETNQPVVLYCSVGYRSSRLARRLMNAGRSNVLNLEGSVFQWANEGRSLVDAQGPASRVHPYNNRWGILLKPQVRGTAD